MNSDKRRYGALIRDIENEHTRGTNSYPTTLTAAYDYLVNYKTNKVSEMDTGEGGMAFLNKHEQQTASSGREQNSGRGRGRGTTACGGGRGAGRYGQGGSGRGHGRGHQHRNDTDVTDEAGSRSTDQQSDEHA
mmetsp:Transcript_13505/g.19474  ORF Transcript_13505/g.19474 Transcript_13505/m.19474 type:complete len:133 (+) Transcript_13505:98-496(+)